MALEQLNDMSKEDKCADMGQKQTKIDITLVE